MYAVFMLYLFVHNIVIHLVYIYKNFVKETLLPVKILQKGVQPFNYFGLFSF